MEHLFGLFRIVPHLNVSLSSQLLFILSCHSEFPHNLVTEEFVHKMLRYITVGIEKSNPNDNVIYLFRTLANLNSREVCDIVLSNFILNNKINTIKKLLVNDRLKDSVMWFLGNAYKWCSRHEFFEKLFV